ncbi:MAG: hypothetical protein HC900_10260, partial [Methylacidiphilales bacterium]|nr:hypothetical protein [Candidatus Methylacidiphilales bacterium]
VVSRHLDKSGKGKLVAKCSLPLTAAGCVHTLITERAVFRRVDGAMTLTSVHPSHTIDSALEGIDADVLRTVKQFQNRQFSISLSQNTLRGQVSSGAGGVRPRPSMPVWL